MTTVQNFRGRPRTKSRCAISVWEAHFMEEQMKETEGEDCPSKSLWQRAWVHSGVAS